MANSRHLLWLLLLLMPLLLLATAATQTAPSVLFHTARLPGALTSCRGVSQHPANGLLRCLWHWQQIAGLVRYNPTDEAGGCESADWCDQLAVNETDPAATYWPASSPHLGGRHHRLVLFALRSGSQLRALDALLSPAGCNQSLMFAPDPGQPPLAFWRSCWLDQLPELMALLPAKVISVELVKANATVLKVNFDGGPTAGLNLMSWFNRSRLISSEPDLSMAARTYNFFSLVGSASGVVNFHNRTFYVNTVFDNCINDAGILAVVERNDDVCAWAMTGNSSSGLPRILYNLSPGIWSGGVTLADSLLITAA